MKAKALADLITERPNHQSAAACECPICGHIGRQSSWVLDGKTDFCIAALCPLPSTEGVLEDGADSTSECVPLGGSAGDSDGGPESVAWRPEFWGARRPCTTHEH